MNNEDKKKIPWSNAITREQWIAMVDKRDDRIDALEEALKVYAKRANLWPDSSDDAVIRISVRLGDLRQALALLEGAK